MWDNGAGGGECHPLPSLARCYCGCVGPARSSRNATVIIAVGAVRMVQVSTDQVIDMIPVRHPLVSATGPVHMVLCVTTTLMLGSAVSRVRGADGQDMIVDVIAVDVMQMPIMQVVGVVAVPDHLMTAGRSVLVVMTLVHATVLLSHPMFLRVFGPSS
jgi:hypothetical protein